ncbi:MAG: hypothetical protein HYY22_05295 [Thaumarchaeota archaeon]|nr:hypothetical protein [Nitrososphaerota archaeon]
MSASASRRQKRIDDRHKLIKGFLADSKSYSKEQGKTASEIAARIDEPVSTVRIDLKSMSQYIDVDDDRTPYKFYLNEGAKR